MEEEAACHCQDMRRRGLGENPRFAARATNGLGRELGLSGYYLKGPNILSAVQI